MIDTRQLYRLPWTRERNPNGWIEPTTYCQLKCPFCYRGVDLDGHHPVHMDVRQVKAEIDELIRLRDVGTISIAGGEPLLYPHLGETIDHVRSKGREVMILTNGLRLDEARLRSLKEREVARIVIHIDKHQLRKGIDTEERANALRQTFCDLFRKVGGVSLGFIQPLGPDDLADLDEQIRFYKRNADVIDLVTFNRLQPVDADRLPPDKLLTSSQLFARVAQLYGLEYAAFLPKTHSDEISWLFGQAIFDRGEMIGSLDADAFRFFQEDHRRRTGRYLHCTRESHLRTGLLGYAPFNRSLRRILWRVLASWGRARIQTQLILIINTPKKLADGVYDMCRGCPDAMLYRGQLVPSCVLELVKAGEPLLAG